MVINQIDNKVDNERKSLISEIVYKKQFEKINLNFGYQNKTGSSKNRYSKESETKENLTENNNYIYGGASGSLKKFSYYLGSGVKILSVKDDIDKKTFVKNHSTVSLMYNASNKFNISLSSFYTPQLPGLSQLTNVTQTYDEVLKMKGNPELKAAYTVGSNLFANYKAGKFNSNLAIKFQRTINTIYTDIQPLEGNVFISQPRNAIGDNHFNSEWNFSFRELFNHVNLFSTIGFNSFVAEGNDYKHRLNDFYWYVGGSVYWGKWTLSAYYFDPKKTLRAQTITVGENNSQISLGFKHKNLNILAAVKYPFTKKGWEWEQENLSKTNPSKTRIYIKDNRNMFTLWVVYSFDFGKGLNKLNKSLNNRDNTTSILKVQD